MNGIHHIKTAVYKPSTNGLAENMVKTFKYYLKSCKGGNLQKRIDQFVFKYRNTPHITTGVSPSELTFGRKVRTIFDLLKPREIKDRILHKQQLQKMYRDPKIPRKFEVDSHKKVFVKDFSNNKNKWAPATIIQQTGPLSYKCATEDNKIVKRHQSQMLVDKSVPNDNSSVSQDTSIPVSPIIPVIPKPVNISDSSGSEQTLTFGQSVEKSTEVLRRNTRISRPPDKLNL